MERSLLQSNILVITVLMMGVQTIMFTCIQLFYVTEDIKIWFIQVVTFCKWVQHEQELMKNIPHSRVESLNMLCT